MPRQKPEVGKMKVGVTVFRLEGLAFSRFAAAAEQRGFHSVYLPEHTHMPVSTQRSPAERGSTLGDDYKRTADPFVSLAAAAAVTDRILLGTGVSLVAQHHPLPLAKTVATLDQIAGGRFVFGVGYGWNRDEMAHHGVEYSSRRAVVREHLLAMQALWREDAARFDGEFVSFSPSWSWPKPVQQPRPRTLIGGGPGPKLFAAIAELADGWMPIGGAGVAAALPGLRRAFADAGRDPATADVVPFGTLPSAAKLEHYADVGITEVVLRVPSGTADDVLPVLDDYTAYLPSGH